MAGFKNFVMRGNLVELAVAVVIGTQFSSLCTAEITPATEQPRQLV